MAHLTSVIALLALAAAAAAGPKPEPTTRPSVEVAGVSEIRGTRKPEPGLSGPPGGGVQVYLRVAGLARPARRGQVVVTEATDDAGTNLVPRRVDGDAEPQDLESEPGPSTRPALLARVDLGLPARQARRIAVLKGELRLTAGAGSRTVKVPGVKALCGKTVDHPELTKAGISVQVGRQGRLGSHELALLFSGDGAPDVSVTVVDAAGADISGGASGSPGKASEGWLVHLRRPLQDTDALNLSIPAGHEVVTVPFELKDIALP
jgi:hypothetical protein